jgi:hypothetical protein
MRVINFLGTRMEASVLCFLEPRYDTRAHSLLSLVLNPKHVCSAPPMLSDWQLGAWTVDTSNQRLVHLPD